MKKLQSAWKLAIQWNRTSFTKKITFKKVDTNIYADWIDGKFRYMYTMRIVDFSARYLQHYIFLNNIKRFRKMVSDKLKGYRPMAKVYDITLIENNNGLNFKALCTMIQKIKSSIRSTCLWVGDFNLYKNFNEICFR